MCYLLRMILQSKYLNRAPSGDFFALMVFFLFSINSGSAFGQFEYDSKTDCTVPQTFPEEMSNDLNEILLKIDKITDTGNMSYAHVDLLQESEGTLNFCEIEKRLRTLNASTYLLAMPYELITGPSEAHNYSLIYLQSLFPTWSPIPKYAIWYERDGKQSAENRLREIGSDWSQNLRNLNRTGLLIPANNIHKNYSTVKNSAKIGLNKKYEWYYDTLIEYKEGGHLTNKYNPLLMYVIDLYFSKFDIGVKKFAINDIPSGDHLQFYVIKDDPDRILSGYRCNCFYIPDSNMIICDNLLLDAISKWVEYGRDDKSSPEILSVVNDAISDLLLHWLIGHEIGHFAMKHSFSSNFLAFDGTHGVIDTLPKSPEKNMELEADQFAMAGMPDRVKGWGHMTTNYLIQQLVGIAQRSSNDVDGDIVVHNNEYGHPNFLLRAYGLKRATGAIDFLLEEYESRTTTSMVDGAKFPGICSLSNQ